MSSKAAPSTMRLHRWISCFVVALLTAACGLGAPSSRPSSAVPALRLDESAKEIVLTNTTDRPMLASGSYGLEERSGTGWVNADDHIARLLGVDAVGGTLDLIELAASGEYRYGITYLQELPPGEYRVTVGTGKPNPQNILTMSQSLTFTR